MITELPRRTETLFVAAGLLERSRELLAPCSAEKVEGCLLWYGYVLDPQSCLVTTCIQPTQLNYPKSYQISADSMKEVRKRVRPHRLLLIVQVHTHPNNAFFSAWDEQHALNKQIGALNLISPNYGDISWIETERFCMVERLDRNWRPWAQQDWDRRLVIVPDALALGNADG